MHQDDQGANLQPADELAEANVLLEALRRRQKRQPEDQDAARHVAQVEERVVALRRRLGLPLSTVAPVVAKSKLDAATVVLLGLAGGGLVLAGVVAVFAITSPGAGETPPPTSTPTLLIVGAAFAMFGLPLVWLAFHTFAKDRNIAKWPRARGTIITSSVASFTYTSRDRQGYNRQYTGYTPEVFYTYVVGGFEFDSKAVARSVSTSNQAAAEKCVARYPQGKEVMVFYDPHAPDTAYLEVRRSTWAIILLLFGGLLTSITLLLVVLHFL